MSDDFSVVTNQNSQAATYSKGLYYRGIVKGDNNSIAAISFFNNEIYGMISDQRNGDMVLARIEKTGNKENYIFYSDFDLLRKNPFTCHTDEQNQEQHDKMLQNLGTSEDRAVNGCVRKFLECDYKLYQNKGNSVGNTVNYITAVYNNIATLYNNEQISTVVSQVYVWVTQDAYPTNSSSSALTAFKTTRGTNYNGDLAHLAALGGVNLGGVAWVDVLCVAPYSYAYSNISASFNTVPTYSWTVEVMTHEMGHNLGSPHTQSCSWTGGALDNCYTTEGGCVPGPAPTNGGTIMSYCHLTSTGINFANGFGTQPGNLIRNYVSTSTCLAASCAAASTCLAPSAITIGTVTSNSAALTWTSPSGANAFNLQYQAQGTTTWTTVSNVTSPYTLSGLIGNTTYAIKMQSVCGTSNSTYSTGFVLKTQTNSTPCDTPIGLAATNVGQTTATLSWSAVSGAANYVVQYKLSTATTWSSVTVTSTSTNLTGLSANKTYNTQIYCNCTSGNYSATSAGGSFNTLGCGVPTNVVTANTTTAGTQVSWTAALGAVSYNVQYKTAVATTWTTKTSTTPSYTITGLVQNTAYQVKVATVCTSAVGSSTYGNPVDFTTSICALASSVAFSNVAQNTATTTWSNPSGATTYKIQWRKTGATTWSSATVNNALTYNFTNLTPNQQYDVQFQTTCTGGISAWSSTYNFTTSTCPTVATINFSNVNPNTATASWAQVLNISSYKIQWKLATATTWSSANVTGLTYNFTNLIPNSTYNVQVTSNCTNGSSVWSATQNLVTPICPVPNNLVLSNIGINTVTATWTQAGPNTGHRVQWRRVGTTTWTGADVTATTYNITNLTANSAYEIQVRTNCSNQQSAYSASSNFTTLANPTCAVPTGLTNTAVTATSLTVNWAASPSAVNYSVQYKRSTVTTWTTIASITTSPYTISGLVSGAIYNVKVRANCVGNGNSSAYSAQINVTLPSLKGGDNGGNTNVTVFEDLGLNSTSREEENTTQSIIFGEKIINIAPNPVRDFAFVTFNFKQNTQVNVELYNSFGQLLQNHRENLTVGSLQLNMNDLPQGIYLVRTTLNEKEVITNKLIKE